MSPLIDKDCSVHTKRLLSATPREVFAASENPAHLAQWWGPSAFTNTFEQFEFKPNGKWTFVMHAPDGANYHNECFFREIEPDKKIVIEHILKPWFMLTVTLVARGQQTELFWDQRFETPEIAQSMVPLSKTANEQVLDRLEGVLAVENS